MSEQVALFDTPPTRAARIVINFDPPIYLLPGDVMTITCVSQTGDCGGEIDS